MWPFSRTAKPSMPDTDPQAAALDAKPLRKRLYAGAKVSRLLFSAPTSSADYELNSSHRALRDRSRQLRRDNPYAKRAKQLVINNIVGPGVGLQAQVKNGRGRLLTETNDAIEMAWNQWTRAETCHTGGELHFCDFERAAMGEVFEAGEAFIRLHPVAFGGGRIPLALELIESERIADDWEIRSPSGHAVTMGVEHDVYYRPIAYHFHRYHRTDRHRHPAQADDIIRVPADQIIHLRVIDRWPQMRGEPWLHAAIERLTQHGEYEYAALVAARIGASKVGFFENPEGDYSGISDGEEVDGTPSATVEAGQFTALPPGYKFSSWDPNYPSDAFEPFVRASLRGLAAAIGPCYESLSRDYSQSNYSSSRLALLDDRDLWRQHQRWLIRALREPLHRRWLDAAVLSGSIPRIERAAYLADPDRFAAVKFKPRGWGWVDPTKEVNAYKEAEKAGYITKTDVIAATAGGLDIEDVISTRRRELDLLDEADIKTDTTHDIIETAAAAPAPDPIDAATPAQQDDTNEPDETDDSPMKEAA